MPSTSWLHLAVTLKFLWSPIVDLFGRKRTWLWVMQVLLGAGDDRGGGRSRRRGNLTVFWSVIVGLAVLHATHDIACDGFYLQALDKQGQALFSGDAQWPPTVRACGSASPRWSFWPGRTNWFWGFGAAGVLMLLVGGSINAFVMPHPPEHHPQDAVPGGRRCAAESERRSWRPTGPSSRSRSAVLVIAFMFLYRLGDIMMFAMATPLLQDIGIDTASAGR